MIDIKEMFAQLLFADLQGASPVDTGNMKGNIQITKFGPKEFEIVVSVGVPYAYWTNVKKYGPKQQFNYLWINRSVQNVAKVISTLFGGSVDDKL
jgi:hypothetical protein